MTTFKQLQQRTITWAKIKGILEHGTPEGQAKKTLEEAIELLYAVMVNKRADIADGIADTLVTIIIQSEMQGMDILAEWEKVLTVLEARKGRMQGGQFVKEK